MVVFAVHEIKMGPAPRLLLVKPNIPPLVLHNLTYYMKEIGWNMLKAEGRGGSRITGVLLSSPGTPHLLKAGLHFF